MNAKKLQDILSDLNELQSVSLRELRKLVQTYPYSQNLRFLLAKKLQLEGKTEDQPEFQVLTSYISDQRHIYDRLTASECEQIPVNKRENELDKLISDQLHPAPTENIESPSQESSIAPEDNLLSQAQKDEEDGYDFIEVKDYDKEDYEVEKTQSQAQKVVSKKEDEKLDPVDLEEIPKGQLSQEAAITEIDKLKEDVLEEDLTFIHYVPKKKKSKIIPSRKPKSDASVGTEEPDKKSRKKQKNKARKKALKKEKKAAKIQSKHTNKKGKKKKTLGSKPPKESKNRNQKPELTELIEDSLSFNDWLQSLTSTTVKSDKIQVKSVPISEVISGKTSKKQKSKKKENNKSSNKKSSKAKKKAHKKAKKKELKKAKKLKLDAKIKSSVIRKQGIVSETLAQVMASQGHIKEAHNIYEQLMLLYPEKSSYFGAQIKKLD